MLTRASAASAGSKLTAVGGVRDGPIGLPVQGGRLRGEAFCSLQFILQELHAGSLAFNSLEALPGEAEGE
jgi:hypothetical protein